MEPVNRADLSKRTDAVASMFDQVAPRYDLANDILALGQTRGWRRAVTSAVGAVPGERVLDVAAGTGTSSEPFVDAGAEVVAVDLSEGMLRVGRDRRPDIDFIQADATHLGESSSAHAFTLSGLGLAMLAALWAYDGWNNLPMAAGEVKQPEKNVPLSLILGVLLDEMERRDAATGLATLCVGAGMGTATIIERI